MVCRLQYYGDWYDDVYVCSGVKGVYSSKTIEGAAHFIRQYANILDAGYV